MLIRASRSLQTFILSTLPYTTLLAPLLLTLVLRPLTFGKINYLPSGPTGTIFALLAQYHASIPSTYRYTISTSSSSPSPSPSTPTASTPTTTPASQTTDAAESPQKTLTISLTDKSTTYLIAAQLALSQFPYMLLPSALGWIVGVAWRADVLPCVAGSGSAGWRVPAWVVGEEGATFSTRNGGGSGSGQEARFEGLRRRLESEAAAAASGSSNSNTDASGSGAGSSRQRAGRG